MTKNNTKQYKILDFISSFIDSYGYPPSVREIGSYFDIASTATVKYYLDKLIDEGLIKVGHQKNRAIEIVNNDRETTSFNKKAPLVGEIRAGEPILAEQNIEEYITIPQEIFRNTDEMFVLRVEGNSMINAGIFEGDYILVKRQETAENGQIVVALIENSATVKRFFKENKYYRLHPENPSYADIICKEVTILGIVDGLIRKTV